MTLTGVYHGASLYFAFFNISNSKQLMQNLAKIEPLSCSQTTITITQDNEGDESNDENNAHSHCYKSDPVLWGEVSAE